jgi:hypothetical protein
MNAKSSSKLFILSLAVVALVGIPLIVYSVSMQQEVRSRADTTQTSETCGTTNQSVLYYQTNAQPYSWTTQDPYYTDIASIRAQDKGKTFTDNKNPWGYEVYACDSHGGTIKTEDGKATDSYSKDVHDICIPQATMSNGMKLWTTANSCPVDHQENYDGPSQTEDNRTLNGTGKPNSQISICTTKRGTSGENPFFNVKKTFNYQPFMCQGSDAVVMSARPDPQNPECSTLDAKDVALHPENYTASQLSCFLYFDDFAVISTDKNGVHQEIKIGADYHPYPLPQPSQSLCSLFTQGSGDYDLTVKLYDNYASMYGSGNIWITSKQALTCPTPTVSPSPTPNVCSPDKGTCAWDPLDGASGYNVVVKQTDTGDVVQSTSVGQDVTQSTFPMIQGKPYQCSVTPTNLCGAGDTATSSAKICQPSVTPTPGLCPSGTSDQGVCRWDALDGATSYNVSVTDTTTGQTVRSDTVQAPTAEFSFPDNGTDTYVCKVTPVNLCGQAPPTQSPPSTCTSPTPTVPNPTPTVLPSPTPKPSPTPTPTPSPTVTPSPTPTPTAKPTPTPVVIVKTITQPPQQTVVQQPGQTTTVQTPGRTVVQPQTQTQTVYVTQPPQVVQGSPVPTVMATGNTTPTVVLVGTSALLLLAGGLIFFIL